MISLVAYRHHIKSEKVLLVCWI